MGRPCVALGCSQRFWSATPTLKHGGLESDVWVDTGMHYHWQRLAASVKHLTNTEKCICLMLDMCLLLQIVDSLKRGHQVMVFVHSRKDTGKTGRIMAELAAKNGETNLFETEGDDPKRGLAVREVNK